ncbi:MAG: hypothetical protein M1838_004256 [Thelocarpon superellum]|nr:MAG: hypothetical protein M1838_004256 [Thelocarpon superellum]
MPTGFIARFCTSARTDFRSGGCRGAREGVTARAFGSGHLSSFSRGQGPYAAFGPPSSSPTSNHHVPTRGFHEYFVTHLPSSSLHPDSRSAAGPHHRLPRSASTPHTPGSGPSPAAAPPMLGSSRDLTVVRIPLRSAKHHFGVSASRGTRPYNEDTYQAGVIELPAFAAKAPVSLTRSPGGTGDGEGTSADSASGDPQVFYFGVFDGHGGAECSHWLREHLHGYIEDAAKQFGLSSTLTTARATPSDDRPATSRPDAASDEARQTAYDALEGSLVRQWRDMVGGYFQRFSPTHFGRRQTSLEAVMTYAFLRADLDFITAQVQRANDDLVQSDQALNRGDVLGEASIPPAAPRRFKGGSTCSVAMVSTPTPTPFWHPASPSSLLVSHVGDTRILLCATADGRAVPLTTDHHPSSPTESGRLRRYAATFVTDSFGEERMTGLANTRSFGDMQSKRIGVSAEPEITRVELKPAEYSFLVLLSDGISGTLHDQEVVDIVKEAKTPDQGATDVVAFATEVSKEGDNATCLVVRLGGWERRSEGGLGSMGTREGRDWRRQEATDPRSRRT